MGGRAMKGRGFLLSIGVALVWGSVGAQQGRPGGGQGRGGQTPPNGPHIYIRAGLKSHGPGQHDYPQFLADWSKVLTERNAVVDGSLHFPKAQELEGVDVM